MKKIMAETYSAEYTNRALVSFRIIARGLQGLPCALQKQALLWVGQFSLARSVAKKHGVKQLNVIENGLAFYVMGTTRLGGIAIQLQFRIIKSGDGFHTIAKVAPELFQIARAGKASGHANDCDSQHLRVSHICLKNSW